MFSSEHVQSAFPGFAELHPGEEPLDAGFLQSLWHAQDGQLYAEVRNAGTYATVIITGGEAEARLFLAQDIFEIARQPNFVFKDRTGRLRASMRTLGSEAVAWAAMRMGGASYGAPYGGYLEAMRPVLATSLSQATR